MIKRIEHIFKKALSISEEELQKNNSKSFEELGNWCMEMFKNHKPGLVDIKINGQVYQGKKRASFPNYLGFICKHGEKELKFTSAEQAGNRAYFNHVKINEPDSESGATSEFID